MPSLRRSRTATTYAVALVVLLWLVVAGLWIDRPGLQYDETIFVSGAFPERPAGAVWRTEFFGHPVAILIMSYMGALKGWIYRALLLIWSPSAAIVRWPLLFLAAATIAVTYRLAATMFCPATGLAATIILAADSTFLFTSRMDWGPVVIQRLCLVVGSLLILSGTKREHWRIVAGAFVFGIGAFDKLTFVWTMAALGVALVTTCFSYARRVASPKLLVICFAAFALPASPAVYYRTIIAPASDPARLEQHSQHVKEKYYMLRNALGGTVPRGAIIRDSATNPSEPRGALQRAFFWADNFGRYDYSWFGPAIAGAMLLLPLTAFLPGGRARLFLGLFCILALIPMAATEGGGSVHHIVLVYPFPHILLASSLVSLSRWLRTGPVFAVAATAGLAMSSGMNIVHQYADLLRYGGTPVWSEAIYKLSDFLEEQQVARVFVGDWGIEHQLIFLSGGAMHTTSTTWFGDPRTDMARKATEQALRESNTVFVRFASELDTPSPAQHTLVDQSALDAGVDLLPIKTVVDLQGRETYQVFELQTGDPNANPR